MKSKFDRNCLFPGFDGVDSVEHIMNECQHYDSKKGKRHMSEVLNMANFLMDLENERQRVFGISLLLSTSSWSC